jgi:type IV pilus assembly protein PilM
VAKLKDINSQFEQKLNMKTAVLNPFHRISFSEKKFDPVYMQEMGPLFGVAVGLAIRTGK